MYTLTKAVAFAGALAAGMAGQPSITNIVPDSAAAGFGQLITIQGFGLDPANSTITLTPQKGGTPLTCHFVFESPSTPNELYVRLGQDCPIPADKYKFSVATAAGTSGDIGFQVKADPATPVPRRLDARVDGVCVNPSGAVGKLIGIQAYGTDTEGAEAVFTQGTRQVTVAGGQTRSSPLIGIVNCFAVPPDLAPGSNALVQLKTTVAGNTSGLSHAMVFTVPY